MHFFFIHTSLRNAYFFFFFFFLRESLFISASNKKKKNKNSVLIETKKIDEILKITVGSGISYYYQFSHDF